MTDKQKLKSIEKKMERLQNNNEIEHCKTCGKKLEK